MYKIGAGQIKFYPFTVREWEAKVMYRFWPNEPSWFKLWMGFRTVIATVKHWVKE